MLREEIKMASSLNHEIPKARINIALDVITEGARKKKELPLKLLVIGDFSAGKTHGTVTERTRININKNNFSEVMKEVGPQLEFSVINKIYPQTEWLPVRLQLDSLSSFQPEFIAAQVPMLQTLMAMRNLLKELKSTLVDNHSLKQILGEIAKDKNQLKRLQQIFHCEKE